LLNLKSRATFKPESRFQKKKAEFLEKQVGNKEHSHRVLTLMKRSKLNGSLKKRLRGTPSTIKRNLKLLLELIMKLQILEVQIRMIMTT
jgi:hypothetical protein